MAKNKVVLSKEEKQERVSTMLDRMNYKNDSLSRGLVLLGIALDVFYFLALYKTNNDSVYYFMMGFSVIYNLLFMLFAFLSAENIKVYSKKFSIISIVLGVLQVVRILIWPLNLLTKGIIASSLFIKIVIYLVISAGCLISAGIIDFIKTTRLNNFNSNKEEN